MRGARRRIALVIRGPRLRLLELLDKGRRQLMHPRISRRKVRRLPEGAQGRRGLICPLMLLWVVWPLEVDALGRQNLTCLPISSPRLMAQAGAAAVAGQGLPRISRRVVLQAVWNLLAPDRLRKRPFLAVVSAQVRAQRLQVSAQAGVVVVVDEEVVVVVTPLRQRMGKTRPEPRRRSNPRRPQGLTEHRAVARSGSKVGVKLREA